MKRFALIVLLSTLLLSLPIWRSSAQTLPPSPQISKADWIASNVDLAIVKAQSDAYKQALIVATQERDSLKQQLADHSTDSATQSAEQRAEVEKLTQRLDDLNSTIDVLGSNLASATVAYKSALEKADKDHKSEVSSYRLQIAIWRGVAFAGAGGLGGAVLSKGDLNVTGICAASGLALDVFLELVGVR